MIINSFHSCGKTVNNNSNLIDHDDPNIDNVDINLDVSDDYPDYTYVEENIICESTTTPVFNRLIINFNIIKLFNFMEKKF